MQLDRCTKSSIWRGFTDITDIFSSSSSSGETAEPNPSNKSNTTRHSSTCQLCTGTFVSFSDGVNDSFDLERCSRAETIRSRIIEQTIGSNSKSTCNDSCAHGRLRSTFESVGKKQRLVREKSRKSRYG